MPLTGTGKLPDSNVFTAVGTLLECRDISSCLRRPDLFISKYFIAVASRGTFHQGGFEAYVPVLPGMFMNIGVVGSGGRVAARYQERTDKFDDTRVDSVALSQAHL